MLRYAYLQRGVDAIRALALRALGRGHESVGAPKAGSPDLHQAKMRFLVLGGCAGYGLVIGAFHGSLTAAEALVFSLDAVVFLMFALYTHQHFARDPSTNNLLRALGLFADHGAALACLAVTGRSAGALAWLPLFIIQGVGIRFGVGWLFASQAIGVVSVLVLCAVNPFFRENGSVELGALLSVLVLPLYFALLAHREARIKAALQDARRLAEDARRLAEEASEAKGHFVAMISHELRTPLTAIAGLNELLRSQVLPADTEQLLAEQHAATGLMLTMVNDVLDLSKVEAGQMQLQAVDFDAQELVLQVLHALSFQATQKGLVVRTELDASLPECVNGSPFHLTRIIQNLVGNAIKFTAAGSITLRVRRSASASHDSGAITVQFEVIDTGIGIPSAALPKIFDRFYQVDAAVTRRFGGTGLGTALVKEFCDLLNGSIRIESEEGVGTRCSVLLPFKRGQDVVSAVAANVPVTEVAVWTDGIADLPGVIAQLVDAGASVCLVDNCHLPNFAAQQRIDPSSVVVLGGIPSMHTCAAVTALGLEDNPVILLAEADHRGPLSSRVVVAAHPDATIARAMRLATLGTRAQRAAARGIREAHRRNASDTADSMRVLIAEDTPTIQFVMRATLEKAGFSVCVAGDGAEALHEAISTRYDTIVLDFNMPKIDGISVLQRIRSGNGPNALTPVIVATAAPTPAIVRQATDAGAQNTLGKPFTSGELVRAVDAALAGAPQLVAEPRDRAAAGVKTKEVTLVLDIEALEGPDSMFSLIDPSMLLSTFRRDVGKHAALLQQAVATGNIALFGSSVHQLNGYAGTLGARRLEWLLSTVPQDAVGLAADGDDVVAKLCETMELTMQALDEWSRMTFCATQ